jgi:DNA repair protein RecO
MRHKYETRGLVLARVAAGETNTLVTLLTGELGLVRARAQGLRRPGAKLAASLTTFSESEVVLVRGKEGWRLTGAVLVENWFERLKTSAVRERAGRVTALLLRLVAGETPDSELYEIVISFLTALATLPEEQHDAVEILAALRILTALGLENNLSAPSTELFAPELLAEVTQGRAEFVARINNGILASGL